jgi:MFS family permease
LGGEWGGAVLLATENAPPGKRAWYGMFPQLGAPLGFLLSAGTFLLLGKLMDDATFLAWGWRVPFVASALLVIVGLWVRLNIHETPDFQKAVDSGKRVRLPMGEVLTNHGFAVVVGTLAAFATFVLFYLMTVFTLGHGTSVLGYAREDFLLLQMIGILCFAAGIPLSALYGDRRGTVKAMLWATGGIFVFGLLFQPLFQAGQPLLVLLFLSLGLFLMGLTYGPCGTMLASLYPVQVRYTGSSLSFNLAGILGAAPAPYVATWLAGKFGIAAVGGYLCITALVTAWALWAIGQRQKRGAVGTP